jgi:hypothetical protein
MIDENFSITMEGGKALVVSGLGMSPAATQAKVGAWLKGNSDHQRSADVALWLEMYEIQHP